jgi:hypothetical protein
MEKILEESQFQSSDNHAFKFYLDAKEESIRCFKVYLDVELLAVCK